MKNVWIAKMLQLLFVIATMIPLAAFAAPSVTSVSGSVTHGQGVTVTGSGFGVKSPVAPAFWDTVSYNGLSNGSVIPVGGSNLWPATCSDVKVYYKTSNPRGKWTAHYSNQWSTDGAKKGGMDGAVVAGAVTTGKLYVTWWNYLSSDPTAGGTNASNKWVRLLSAPWGTSNEGTVIWEPTQLYSYGFTSGYLPTNHWPGTGVIYPAWNRMEMYIDSTTANSPDYQTWVNNVSVGHYSSTPSQTWKLNTLGCLGFDGSNTAASQQPTVDFGEVYADNTRARVEICNASTKNSSNHCEIQIPQNTWIDGQLEIKVNQGSFADGTTAYLYVIDASGNVSAGKQISFGSSGTTSPPSSDSTPPVVSLTNPLAGATLNSSISVSASASDNVDVDRVEFYVDGVLSNTDITSPYSYSWDTTSVANGTHKLIAKAFDAAGNSGQSSEITVTVSNAIVDSTPPTSSITSPSAGSALSGNAAVAATATDNVAVTKVELYVDGSLIGNDTTSPYSFVWNTSAIANGVHTLFVKAYDAAGNVGQSSTISVMVNNVELAPGQYSATFGNVTGADYPNTVEDTYMDINSTVFTSSSALNVYTWPALKPANAIIMKWNLSALPANAIIQSATLYLYMDQMEATGGDALYEMPVHALINKNPNMLKVNGFTYDGTNSWTANSVAYNNVPMAQADIGPVVDAPIIDKTFGYKTWNVTSIVADWMKNPSNNLGMLLNASMKASADSNRGFASSDSADPSRRPKLVIIYTHVPDVPKNLKGTVIVN